MRLVAVLVLVAVFFVASSEAGLFKDNEYVKMFQQFITKFKRAYSTSTFAKKLVAFKRNIDTITSANKVKGRFQLGVNQFADLSASEFKAYLGARPPTSGAALIEAQAEGESAAEMTEEELNASFAGGFSWEDKLLAPRMQHQCGSCYSFAAASTIEAAVAIAGGKKEYIAPQPAVNCAAGCFGCNGGFATCVFKYATDTGRSPSCVSPCFRCLSPLFVVCALHLLPRLISFGPDHLSPALAFFSRPRIALRPFPRILQGD
jgi:hypothetical protein